MIEEKKISIMIILLFLLSTIATSGCLEEENDSSLNDASENDNNQDDYLNNSDSNNGDIQNSKDSDKFKTSNEFKEIGKIQDLPYFTIPLTVYK